MTHDTNGSAPYGNADLVLLFRRASRMMARAFHRCAHAHHAQENVLSIIRERGSIKQAELLELLDVRSSSLSELLGKLQRNGLIERTRNEKDKRSFIISATQQAGAPPAGRWQGQGRHKGRQQSADALFACLDAAERQQLGTLLQKLIGSLENEGLCPDCSDGPDTAGASCGRGKGRHPHGDWHCQEAGVRHPGRGGRGSGVFRRSDDTDE